MAPSDTVIQPQLLTAAALTWQLLSQAEKRPQISSHVYTDDVPNLDDATSSSSQPIPIITPDKKRPSVAPHLIAASYDSSSTSSPVVIKPRVKQYESKKARIVPVVIPESPKSTLDAAATTPRVARVSAATMRNIQSRQRVLSAMEQYKLKNSSCESQRHSVLLVVIRESPSVAHCSTPLSDIDCEPTH